MDNSGNFFSQETEIFNARARAFLEKFENGGLDKLVEKWWRVYFEKQTEIQDEEEFKLHLVSQINICIEYLTRKRTKNDKDEALKIHWIKETYKALLYDSGNTVPKQEGIIEQVGAKEQALSTLNNSVSKI